MCEFHGSNGNGFGDIWWTDNPIYIDYKAAIQPNSAASLNHEHKLEEHDVGKIQDDIYIYIFYTRSEIKEPSGVYSVSYELS